MGGDHVVVLGVGKSVLVDHISSGRRASTPKGIPLDIGNELYRLLLLPIVDILNRRLDRREIKNSSCGKTPINCLSLTDDDILAMLLESLDHIEQILAFGGEINLIRRFSNHFAGKRSHYLIIDELFSWILSRFEMVRLWVRTPYHPNMTILDLARRCYGWRQVFEDASDEIQHAATMLNHLGDYYPPKPCLFRAFELTPLSSVRVVLVGQDPYHGTSHGIIQATGCSFMTPRGVELPVSLLNIYKELERSIPDFHRPNHGDLSAWARQGVLLLNACLTVKPGQPGSHGDIWSGFIMRVVTAICHVNPRCIFVLWGQKAQRIKSLLTQSVYVLESAHPSGLARRARDPFFGNNHFVRINEILATVEAQLPEDRRRGPIDWRLD